MITTRSNTKPVKPDTKIEHGPGKVPISLKLRSANTNAPERYPVGGSMSFDTLPDVEALAREQGVQSDTKFEDLLGDFWPEDQSVEDFFEARKRWRREGRNSSD